MKQTSATPRWTFGRVIRKKPIKFVGLTLLLTVLLVVLLDPVITDVVRGMGIEGNSLGGVFLAVLLVVSLIISGVVLTVVSNARLASMDPAAAAKLFEKQNHFYWSRVYSVAIGYVVWFALEYVYFQRILPTTESALVQILAFLVPFAVAQLIFTAFNALMVRLTGTNQDLIRDFQAGRYNHMLPASCRDQESFDGILRVLRTAEASSIRSAILVYRTERVIFGIFRKIARFLGKAAKIYLIFVLIFGLSSGSSIKAQLTYQAQFNAALARSMRDKAFASDLAAKLGKELKR